MARVFPSSERVQTYENYQPTRRQHQKIFLGPRQNIFPGIQFKIFLRWPQEVSQVNRIRHKFNSGNKTLLPFPLIHFKPLSPTFRQHQIVGNKASQEIHRENKWTKITDELLCIVVGAKQFYKLYQQEQHNTFRVAYLKTNQSFNLASTPSVVHQPKTVFRSFELNQNNHLW